MIMWISQKWENKNEWENFQRHNSILWAWSTLPSGVSASFSPDLRWPPHVFVPVSAPGVLWPICRCLRFPPMQLSLLWLCCAMQTWAAVVSPSTWSCLFHSRSCQAPPALPSLCRAHEPSFSISVSWVPFFSRLLPWVLKPVLSSGPSTVCCCFIVWGRRGNLALMSHLGPKWSGDLAASSLNPDSCHTKTVLVFLLPLPEILLDICRS